MHHFLRLPISNVLEGNDDLVGNPSMFRRNGDAGEDIVELNPLDQG
jgi:hypothetical protein